jgi:hypothetical protein
VEVAPGGGNQVELGADAEVLLAHRGIVVRVVGLDAGDAHRRQPRQLPALEPGDAGVGDGDGPAGGAHQPDRLARLEPEALHVGGAPLAQEPIERLLDAGHRAGLQDGARHVRAADDLPVAELLDVGHPDVDAERGQLLDDGVHPDPPVRRQLVPEALQAGMLGVQEVAEQVDLPFLEEGGELDPGDEPQRQAPRRLGRRAHAGHGVVIGERPDGDAGPRHLLRHLVRRVLAVGGAAVGVEVDASVERPAALFHEWPPRAC